MEFILLLGGGLILIIILNLRSRIEKLEQLLQEGQPQNVPITTLQSKTPQTNIQQLRQYHQTEPDWPDKFAAWLKEDWLLKLGAFLLLIGFGWLTSYAFLNNWIGPMGRITMGLVAGALFLLLGWFRIPKYQHQGAVFLVLGSTTILLTLFAAREIYDFFTPLSALVVMFLSTAFVAFASVIHKRPSLSLASLLLAGIAPLLTNSPTPNYIGLFTYLFIVVLGAIWITTITQRRELTSAALILIIFYSLPHLVSIHSPSTDIPILLLFAYGFALLFFITNTIGILQLKDKEIIPDLITAAGNGLLLLAWIMTAAPDEWKSLIIAAWMIVFAAGAFVLYKITQRKEPFYVHAGIGVAMLAAATSAELQGATLTIAYTVEVAMISFVVYAVLQNIRIALRSTLLLAFPMLLSLTSLYSYAWTTGVFHKDFFVLLVLGITLLGLGVFFLPYANNEIDDKEPKQMSVLLLIIGSLYMYTLLWLSLQAGLQNNDTAVTISLIIYTIIGLASYLYGTTNQIKGFRLYGGTLLGGVVARLLLVDVWGMELTGKIITFFLIGTLLVSTAFLGKKKA